MRDGVRSVVGMAAGCFCAVVAAVLYFREFLLVHFPLVLAYLSPCVVICTLIGGLAGYCLGEEGDPRGEDEQDG